MFDEEIARINAQAEQARAGLTDLADLMGVFRSKLIDQGFEEEQAFELVRDYFATRFAAIEDDD